MAPVTAGLPLGPLIAIGPAALSVQSVGTAVPPVVPLSTALTNVSVGAMAVLVILHVAFWPRSTVTVVPVEEVPPVHTQADAL